MTKDIAFSSTPYLPEYSRLRAIVGSGRVKADHWPSWARLVTLYGWKSVIRAAEYLEPENRWPGQVESLCRQYQRDEQATAPPAPRQTTADERKAVAERLAKLREELRGQ